jgi:hypothetical protein
MTIDPKPTESAKSGWEDWATRLAGILAVLAALASARWGASNLQAILKQGQINDAWAYYQAKSLKQQEAEQSRDMLTALAKGETPERAATFDALRAHLADLAKREEQNKLQQQRQAIGYETTRDEVVESSFWLEISFAALQLGVILCTIAAGAKRKSPCIAGIACGTLGLIIMSNGFLHFYHAPRSWYQGTTDQMANDG